MEAPHSAPRNAIYAGKVWHKRLAPAEHAFRYNLFYLLIDLDEFDDKSALPWCLSLDRFNLFSIWQKDYDGDAETGLKTDLVRLLGSAGVKTPNKIFMLTMPRVLGYGFNPITLFYAVDANDQVIGIIYEVHNTFGESHSYVFPIAKNDAALPTHSIDKELYVSPFYEVTGKYKFQTSEPSGQIKLNIQYLTVENDIRMIASLATKRLPLTAGQLMKKFFSIPLIPVKVVGAIHFEALRLWIKRVPLVSRPAPPTQPYSAPRQHNPAKSPL